MIKSGDLVIIMENIFTIKKCLRHLTEKELKSLFLDSNTPLKRKILRVIEEKEDIITVLIILRTLIIIGDPTAKSLCKELVLHVLEKGELKSIQYIIQFDCGDLIKIQEFESMLQNTNSRLWKIIFENSKERGILNYGPALDILKKLTEIGVPTADKTLRKEIVKKISEGLEKGINLLITNYYCHYLNKEDVEYILQHYDIDLAEFIKEELIKPEEGYDNRKELLEFLKKVYQNRGNELIELMFTEIFDKKKTFSEGYFLGLQMILKLSDEPYVIKKISDYLQSKQYFFENNFFESYYIFDILEFLLNFFTTKKVIAYIRDGSSQLQKGFIKELNFIHVIFHDLENEELMIDKEIEEQQKQIIIKVLKTADYEFIRTMLEEIIYTLMTFFKKPNEITQLLSQNILNKYHLSVTKLFEEYKSYYSSDSCYESAGYYTRLSISDELIQFIKSFL